MSKKPADALARLDVTKQDEPRRTAAKPEAIRQLTLYLNARAHRELKLLAIDQDTKVHALLIEATNDLFQKYGRKPVAIQRVRSTPS